MRWIPASSTAAACAAGRGFATTPPGSQQTSAGRISVATCPGGPCAAATASAASAPACSGRCEVRIQLETLRATVSMSLWSCAS